MGVCACVFSCINQRQIKCSNSFPDKGKITSNKLKVFSLFSLRLNQVRMRIDYLKNRFMCKGN